MKMTRRVWVQLMAAGLASAALPTEAVAAIPIRSPMMIASNYDDFLEMLANIFRKLDLLYRPPNTSFQVGRLMPVDWPQRREIGYFLKWVKDGKEVECYWCMPTKHLKGTSELHVLCTSPQGRKHLARMIERVARWRAAVHDHDFTYWYTERGCIEALERAIHYDREWAHPRAH